MKEDDVEARAPQLFTAACPAIRRDCLSCQRGGPEAVLARSPFAMEGVIMSVEREGVGQTGVLVARFRVVQFS